MQAPAPHDQLGHHVLEAAFVDRRDHAVERGGQRLVARRVDEQPRARLLQQLLRRALVGHGEMRRHVRLEREALEHRLAEGVDGLDAQPPLGVEHAREEAACPGARLFVGRRAEQARRASVSSSASGRIDHSPSRL